MEDNILFKNICHEIMRECHNKEIKVKKNFVVYFIKLLLVDPKWNISLESEEINRLDLQKIVKYVIQTLADEFVPSLITLKIQQIFDSLFDVSVNIINKHRFSLLDKLYPLKKEILENRSESEEDLEILFKKIVVYLTLTHGLGNPTKDAVYKEAGAALRSIFDMVELRFFIETQPTQIKEDELSSLADLMMGIRLFNRDCKKGGSGIEDLPSLLTEAIDATNHELQKGLIYTMDTVNALTTALDNCYQMVTAEETNLILSIPVCVLREDIEYAKDLLVCFRQYEIFTRKIMVETEAIEDKTRYIFAEYESALAEAHNTVQFKTAIAASQIYPLFKNIAFAWQKMQDQVIYVCRLNQILVNMEIYMKQLQTVDDLVKQIIGDNPILTDAERLQQSSHYRISQLQCTSTVLKPSALETIDTAQIEYLGFCAWKFVESDGALIPGNPSMGIVQYENRYYVFSSVEGALEFEKAPKRYIYEALDLARRKPQFINFLQLYDYLITVRTVAELVTKETEAVVTHEVEVQTDVHPVTRKFEPEYIWNIWDLKRQALSMADVSKRKTHSTQTEQSNAKNAVRLQTETTEEKMCQTTKDNYSNVPTQLNYVYGLRGRKDDKQFIITLTRPIDEDHDQCL